MFIGDPGFGAMYGASGLDITASDFGHKLYKHILVNTAIYSNRREYLAYHKAEAFSQHGGLLQQATAT